MADRHKTPPKTVRIPDGLLAWFQQFAAIEDKPLNAVLVAALEEYRERHGGS